MSATDGADEDEREPAYSSAWTKDRAREVAALEKKADVTAALGRGMVLWLEDGRVVRTLKVFQKQSEHRVCFGTDEAAEHDAKQSVRVADLWAGGGTGV